MLPPLPPPPRGWQQCAFLPKHCPPLSNFTTHCGLTSPSFCCFFHVFSTDLGSVSVSGHEGEQLQHQVLLIVMAQRADICNVQPDVTFPISLRRPCGPLGFPLAHLSIWWAAGPGDRPCPEPAAGSSNPGRSGSTTENNTAPL